MAPRMTDDRPAEHARLCAQATTALRTWAQTAAGWLPPLLADAIVTDGGKTISAGYELSGQVLQGGPTAAWLEIRAGDVTLTLSVGEFWLDDGWGSAFVVNGDWESEYAGEFVAGDVPAALAGLGDPAHALGEDADGEWLSALADAFDALALRQRLADLQETVIGQSVVAVVANPDWTVRLTLADGTEVIGTVRRPETPTAN